MKRHSFSVILLAASLLSAGFVTSCKDSDADLLTELERNQHSQQETLQDQLKKTQDALDEQIKALEQSQKDLDDALAALLGKADTADVNALKNQLDGLIVNGDTVTLAEFWQNQLNNSIEDGSLSTALVGANVVVASQDVKDAITNATEAQTKVKDLTDDVEANAKDIQDLKSSLSLVDEAVKAAQAKADSAMNLAKKDSTTLADVQQSLTKVTGDLDSLKHVRDSLKILNNTANLAIDSAAAAYRKATDLGTELALLQGTVGYVTELAKSDSARADSLRDAIAGINEKMKTYVDSLQLADSCKTLRDYTKALFEQAVADAKSYTDDMTLPLYEAVESLKASMEDYDLRITKNEIKISKLQEKIDDVNGRLDDFEDRISTLEGEVASLRKDVNDLKNDLAKLITGIIIQGTEDPVFGYAALPFGMQTNILAGYYGDALNDEKLQFPTTSKKNYVSASQAFTADEQRVAGFEPQYVAQGTDTIYAGKLYVTINPTNIDFTGQTLTLETSAGNASPILLKEVKKSTTELSFGITKAARSNGFYEAEAYILPADASKAAPNYDLASVKSVASQLINEKTVSLSNAVSALYNNVQNICPRYGAYVSWENSKGESVAVYSNYALAAIAIKPLSYNFLAGKTFDFGYSIPTIDENLITDAVKNLTKDFKVDFDFGEIDLGLDSIDLDFSALKNLDLSLSIAWDSITFDTQLGDIKVPFEYNLPVYSTSYTIDSATIVVGTDTTLIRSLTSLDIKQDKDSVVYDTITINLDNQLSSVFSSIQHKINASMDSVISKISSFSGELSSFTGNLQKVFDQLDSFTSTISGMQASIDTTFTNISGKLETQINTMIENLTSNISTMFTGYITTANSYITKINSVIDRVTSIISDPNSKLQPVLLYTTGSGTTAITSSTAAIPTTLKLSGSGQQGTTLIATSYTGEILAPAYKKYIAVVDVINGDKSAQGGDATCLAAAKLANSKAGSNFNEVIDGGQRAAVFTTDSKYAGYTYVIAYAAVDYSGKIVTNRYYVKVTK